MRWAEPRGRGSLIDRSRAGSFSRPACRSCPIQCALAPGVGIPDKQKANEHEHLHQRKKAKLAERDRPWEKEDSLDVEDHEDQGVEIEVVLELNERWPDRLDAALVRRILDPVRLAGGEESREDQRK